jgi:hypothetical protein
MKEKGVKIQKKTDKRFFLRSFIKRRFSALYIFQYKFLAVSPGYMIRYKIFNSRKLPGEDLEYPEKRGGTL